MRLASDTEECKTIFQKYPLYQRRSERSDVKKVARLVPCTCTSLESFGDFMRVLVNRADANQLLWSRNFHQVSWQFPPRRLKFCFVTKVVASHERCHTPTEPDRPSGGLIRNGV